MFSGTPCVDRPGEFTDEDIPDFGIAGMGRCSHDLPVRLGKIRSCVEAYSEALLDLDVPSFLTRYAKSYLAVDQCHLKIAKLT